MTPLEAPHRWKLDPLSAVAIVLLVVGLAVFAWSRLWQPTAPPTSQLHRDSQSQQSAAMVPEPAGELVVYVSGQVARPGIVYLPEGSRVADALDKVGGALPQAPLESLNLARKLSDGEQIHVGADAPIGEGGATADGSPPQKQECVDINTADETQLQELDGVGPALAERIVNYRESHGPFPNADALMEVSGIGTTRLRNVKDFVCQP